MISVVVPVYNVKPYIKKCMYSILNQSYQEIEILIVDDGSTDGCFQVCEDFKEKDSRIKVIHQKNQGLSQARNQGIAMAKGEYITFVDSDDWIHKDMLAILYNNIKETDADISVCEFAKVFEKEAVTDVPAHNEREVYSGIGATEKIVIEQKAHMIVAWGKLYRTSSFSKISFPIGKYHEDEFVTYRLMYEAQKVVCTNAKLYYYLQRDTGITGMTYNKKRLDKLIALKEAITFFEGKDERLKISAQYRYLLNIQIAYYKSYYQMNNPKEVLLALEKEYNQGYDLFVKQPKQKKYLKKNVWMQFAFFYYAKKLFCRVVNVYVKLFGGTLC